MPVSYMPLIVPMLLIGVPVSLLVAGKRRAFWITSALKLGNKPLVEEEYFYWHVYRGLYVQDIHENWFAK